MKYEMLYIVQYCFCAFLYVQCIITKNLPYTASLNDELMEEVEGTEKVDS